MNKQNLSTACLLLLLAGASICGSEIDPYRLNPAVQPLRQQLEMTIDPNRPDYVGSTHIVLEIREAVASVVLHAQDITILGAKFGHRGELKVANFEQREHSLLHISTGSRIEPGEYHLKIRTTSIRTASACTELKSTAAIMSLHNWRHLRLGRHSRRSTNRPTSSRGR